MQSVYQWIIKPQIVSKASEMFLPGRMAFVYDMVCSMYNTIIQVIAHFLKFLFVLSCIGYTSLIQIFTFITSAFFKELTNRLFIFFLINKCKTRKMDLLMISRPLFTEVKLIALYQRFAFNSSMLWFFVFFCFQETWH